MKTPWGTAGGLLTGLDRPRVLRLPCSVGVFVRPGRVALPCASARPTIKHRLVPPPFPSPLSLVCFGGEGPWACRPIPDRVGSGCPQAEPNPRRGPAVAPPPRVLDSAWAPPVPNPGAPPAAVRTACAAASCKGSCRAAHPRDAIFISLGETL